MANEVNCKVFMMWDSESRKRGENPNGQGSVSILPSV